MKIPRRKLFLVIGDIFIILLALELAYLIRLNQHLPLLTSIPISLIFLIYILSFYIFDLYNLDRKLKSNRFIIDLIGALAFVSVIVTIYFYVLPFQLGRGIFLISISLIGVLAFGWRVLFALILKVAILPERILIVGTGKAGQTIYSLIKDNLEYEFVGFVDVNPKDTNISKEKVFGDIHSLAIIADEHKVDEIILTVEPTKRDGLNKNLIKCRMKGINIHDMPTFYEYLTGKLPISYIKEKWFLYADGFSKTGSIIYRRLKRVLDILISTILLICFFPVILIFSLAIKLSSRGPILFVQERLGENSAPFKLYKFRTMVENAETGVPKWAEENDIRVTKIGFILRKLRLDELPQLINVLKGDMSLVGPRPEREYFIKKLTKEIPYYSLRFSVKPGLTGWAQVNFRYGSSLEDSLEKLCYDLYYVKNMTLLLDLKILLKTIRIILFAVGR